MNYVRDRRPLDIGDLTSLAFGLVRTPFYLGAGMVRAATGVADSAFQDNRDVLDGAFGLAANVARTAAGGFRAVGEAVWPKSACGEIPPPCWAPVDHGTVRCALAPSARARVAVAVLNDDGFAHDYLATAVGADHDLVHISPAKLTLGPKERGFFTFTLETPAAGELTRREIDTVLWINGCQKHYVRWLVEACGTDCDCCHDLSFIDRHDYIVHWYDHFYCADKSCAGAHPSMGV